MIDNLKRVVASIGCGALFISFMILPVPNIDTLVRTSETEDSQLPKTEVKQNYTRIEITKIILDVSTKYNVDFELAFWLANFESSLYHLAQNPNSTAKGIYQFLDGTWSGYCEGDVFNPYDNIDCALRMISEGGIGHWLADPKVRSYLISKDLI